MKKYIFLLLGIVLFLPTNVSAQTTVSMCNEGCDYTNFNELADDYRHDVLTDEDLTIEVGEGEFTGIDDFDDYVSSNLKSLEIKGISKEKSKLSNFSFVLAMNSSEELQSLVISDLSIETLTDFTLYVNYVDNFELEDLNITIDRDITDSNGEQFIRAGGKNVKISNVVLNYNYLNPSLNNDSFYDGVYLYGDDITISDLTINNNSNVLFHKGLIIDRVLNANINNLVVNNSEVGLYVHRNIENDYFSTVNSEVEVNNSNLLNNTCSSFNILDDNSVGVLLPINNNLRETNMNYQVVFNKNNKLNCAVASGNDTNTYISADNTWDKEPVSYTYDEIDYDNLTNTVQNANNGTVDIAKSYKGTVIIEEGSSVDDNSAFDVELNLDGVTWTSEDKSIARIENGKILGLKEGTTTITGVSSDELTTYEIVVNVVKNPVTNSMTYVGIGVILILVLGTALYTVYRIKTIVKED